MNTTNYTVFTDSACDIPRETLEKWGVKYACLSFAFDGDAKQYGNYDLTAHDFYQRMRDGEVAKTSAVNVGGFKDCFADELAAGNDILYLAFSSGLSTTYQSACIAAEELTEKYPDRKVLVVDTLCASAGFGMLLYLTLQKKEAGATMEEAAQFAEDTKLNICHWFTVDDLVYLKRGGRVSAVVAFAGGLLGIKPVLHVDNDGHLISRLKVRGRKEALKALVDKMGELAKDPSTGPVYICHAECENDVNFVKELIKERFGTDVGLVVDIGPVIGAHAGPGTLGLFFVGKER